MVKKKFDFTKIKIETIDRTTQEVDASKVIGNTIYYGVTDIAMTDIGREIYEKGSVELDSDQVQYFRQILLSNNSLTGVLKSGLEKFLLMID